jgi:hypothetical protein
MVCCGLPVGRPVEHHAPSIRLLGDLDFSIALSLESHRHLYTFIIDSIVGVFVIRFSAMSHIFKLHMDPAETTVVKRFQFHAQLPALRLYTKHIAHRTMISDCTVT